MNAIILASGFSKRMGKNKLLMKIGKELIIEKVIKTIKISNFSNIILVGNDKKVIELAINYGIKPIKNESPGYGQSQSIKLGLKEANLEYNFMFFCGDQPFIDTESINKLIDASNLYKENIIIPRFIDKIGSPVIFPKSLKQNLENLQGDVGGKEVIRNNKDLVKYVDIDNCLFLQDIDTIEDYKEFIEVIKK
ncbi:NTP transferase domain-containing protein [Clostridium sp. MB05]|jgi:molybdenum cofactor cytidylyltransferase|uniref:NTP transferase domain-containing protein n=1 Tax=Clostridium sp. MB05 TaxID=3376682 RepID=UPI003981DFA6